MTFLVTGEGSKEFLLNCLHKTRSKTVLTSPRHQGRFFFLATWTAQHSKYCSRSGKCYRRTLKWKNTRLQLKSAFDKMATWRNVSAVSLFFSSYDGWNIGWNVFKLITQSVWSYSSGHVTPSALLDHHTIPFSPMFERSSRHHYFKKDCVTKRDFQSHNF